MTGNKITDAGSANLSWVRQLARLVDGNPAMRQAVKAALVAMKRRTPPGDKKP